MAYTKIHAIEATVDKAVAYICNPAKTDNSILITSYCCSPETVDHDFRFALSQCSSAGKNQAFHLIQSFCPGEISYEDAHKVGAEFAEKLLGNEYSYILTTHIDRNHIHNHIIFCAANLVNHKKYNDCKKSYYHLRSLSDEICQKYQLSVIPEFKESPYRKLSNLNTKTTSADLEDRFIWKSQIQKDIDQAILNASTFEEFIIHLENAGYEIKGTGLNDDHLSSIAFRPKDKKRFMRGTARSLGADYTRESIIRRIADRSEKGIASDSLPTESPANTLANEKITKRLLHSPDLSTQKLIDTSSPKINNSQGFLRWAEKQNLKIAAAAYLQVESLTELDQKLAAAKNEYNALKAEELSLGKKYRTMTEILYYADQYEANKKAHLQYQKARNKEAYLEKHETELLLFEGAERFLKQAGITPKVQNIADLKVQYKELSQDRKVLAEKRTLAEKTLKELDRQQIVLHEYLQKDFPDKSHDKHLSK